MGKLLYKPGDNVTIRSDLKGDTNYPILYGPAAEFPWYWTESMFEDPKECFCESLL